jgi:hypothetical protein
MKCRVEGRSRTTWVLGREGKKAHVGRRIQYGGPEPPRSSYPFLSLSHYGLPLVSLLDLGFAEDGWAGAYHHLAGPPMAAVGKAYGATVSRSNILADLLPYPSPSCHMDELSILWRLGFVGCMDTLQRLA